MYYVWFAAGVAGTLLQVLVVSALLRGQWRQFRILFCYCLVLVVTSAVEAEAFLSRDFSARTAGLYWIFDSVRQTLLYLMVISLVHRASETSTSRATVQRLLVGGTIVFVMVSLPFTFDANFKTWMTVFGRNLGFLAVVLNLMLWAALIRNGRADRRLLMISGGLGIQMAGKAIGHSLRYLSESLTTTGNVILVASHLFCMYLWWRAFSEPKTEFAGRRLTQS
jgi:hypothetical protein